MKKILVLSVILCSFILAALPGAAQTNTSPAAPAAPAVVAGPVTNQISAEAATFFTTAQSWLTSFNHDFTFTNVTLEASTGYKQATGVGASSFVDVQYDINRFNVGGSFQFSGVGSAINIIEGQFGYALIEHYDVKVDANLLLGYDSIVKAGVIEPAITLKKKLTENTFAETGISLPELFNQRKFNNSPQFKVGMGFTF